jgi:hypothetical protein
MDVASFAADTVGFLQNRGNGFPAAIIEAESLSHTSLPIG